MSKHLLNITLIGCVALGGCASNRAAERPVWILGETSEYTHDRFLLGRGQATQLDIAKDRARADVAKTFQVHVVERSADVVRFQKAETGAAAQGTPQLEQNVSRDVSASTDQLVRGVTIAQTWQDPDSKIFHALAVLPRHAASQSLRQDIQKLDAAIAGHMQRARDTTELLPRVAHASRAVGLHAERDTLQQTLAVVDIAGRGVESSYSTGQLEADLQQLLHRINVRVENAADEPGMDARELLTAAVHTVGLSQDPARAANYVLTGGIELDEPKKLHGVYWVTGSLKITLRHPETLHARGSKRWPLKAGSSVDGTLAERKVRAQAQTLVNREITDALVEFAGLQQAD